jgi:aspartokinase-like uncharacterized kinase
MTGAPTVVKVGGSLFDLPGLGPRLSAWLKTLRQREIILITGGGAAADAVRDLDRTHGLGEEAGHWLALRSLSLTAHALSALLPRSFVIEHHGECLPIWAREGIPIFDPHAFALRDESRPDHLPHRWDVTSDSLAARVAVVTQARELLLLKSVTVPPGISWEEASRRGFVDAYFPTVVSQVVAARAVNLRSWQP